MGAIVSNLYVDAEFGICVVERHRRKRSQGRESKRTALSSSRKNELLRPGLTDHMCSGSGSMTQNRKEITHARTSTCLFSSFHFSHLFNVAISIIRF